MTKIFIGIAVGLLLGLLGHYILTFFSTSEVIPYDFARVTIKNESGKNVGKVLLQHEKGSIEANGLMDNEEVRFIF